MMENALGGMEPVTRPLNYGWEGIRSINGYLFRRRFFRTILMVLCCHNPPLRAAIGTTIESGDRENALSALDGHYSF